MQPFERLQQFANLQKPPAIKFKDLEAAVSSKITYNVLPMRVRVDYVRMTNSSVLTNITLLFERKDLQFQAKDGVQKATVNIYARITSMARRVVNIFEDVVTVDVPAELLQEAVKGSSVYGKSVSLPPGMYRLNVVAKDVVGGNMNNYEVALNVPRYDDETLASSTLVLADLLEPVPTRNIGAGQFVVRNHQGAPARGGELPPRREDGRVRPVLQLRAGREDAEAERLDPVRGDQGRHQREGHRFHGGRDHDRWGFGQPGHGREAAPAAVHADRAGTL